MASLQSQKMTENCKDSYEAEIQFKQATIGSPDADLANEMGASRRWGKVPLPPLTRGVLKASKSLSDKEDLGNLPEYNAVIQLLDMPQ